MPWRPIAARTARIAPTTCGGAAPGAPSRARCAAASQRSATSRSPLATAWSPRRAPGWGATRSAPRPAGPAIARPSASGSGRANVGTARQSRLAARSASPAVIAWSSAAARSPCSSCQTLARRWTSSSSRGSRRRRRARSAPLTRGWTRNCSSERSRAGHRQARPRQPAQGAARPAAVEDRVAEPAGQPLERGGALEQREVVGRQVGTGARPRRSRRRSGRRRRTGHRGAEVALLAERQAGEVQRRRPALGGVGQRHRVRGVQAQPGAAQHERRLAVAHDEVRHRAAPGRVVGAQAPDGSRGSPRMRARAPSRPGPGRPGRRAAPRRRRRRGRRRGRGRGRGGRSRRPRPGPAPSPTPRRRRPGPRGRAAPRRWRRPRRRAGSWAGSCAQANGRSSRASHCARRADFP